MQEDREKRIKKESNRYKKLYKEYIKSHPEMFDLIDKSSKLLILSQDMEEELIQEDEFVKFYENGNQSYVKTNPLLKEHRDTVKSYQSLIKQISDIVDNCINVEKQKEQLNPKNKQLDELEAFIQ